MPVADLKMKRNLMNELTEGIGALGQLRKYQEEIREKQKLIDEQNKEIDVLRKTCTSLREYLMNPPPDVQEKVLDMLGVNKRMVDLIEQYNELRAAINFLISCEDKDLRFILNSTFKHILEKHDEQS